MKSRLSVKVRTGARKTEFAGKNGSVWTLRVAAPPVDGKANKEILRYIAKLSGVASRQVRIVVGETATIKIIEVDGIDGPALDRAILESHGESHGPRTDSGSAAP